MQKLIMFALVGVAAQLVDGSLGMAHAFIDAAAAAGADAVKFQSFDAAALLRRHHFTAIHAGRVLPEGLVGLVAARAASLLLAFPVHPHGAGRHLAGKSCLDRLGTNMPASGKQDCEHQPYPHVYLKPSFAHLRCAALQEEMSRLKGTP